MNLELFKDKNAAPSDSWWERLFNSHGDIAFDDYDKDFTDLPTPIAEVSVLVCLWLCGRVCVCVCVCLYVCVVRVYVCARA